MLNHWKRNIFDTGTRMNGRDGSNWWKKWMDNAANLYRGQNIHQCMNGIDSSVFLKHTDFEIRIYVWSIGLMEINWNSMMSTFWQKHLFFVLVTSLLTKAKQTFSIWSRLPCVCQAGGDQRTVLPGALLVRWCVCVGKSPQKGCLPTRKVSDRWVHFGKAS